MNKTGIANNAVKLTFAKVTTQAISLFSTMLMARFLSLEEYGTYSQVMLVIIFVTTLLMLGLPNSVNYFMGKADTIEEKRDFLSTFYSLSTLLCVLTGLILWVGTPVIVKYFDNQLIFNVAFFMLLYPLGRVISSSAENLYIVYNKTTFLVAYRICYSLSLLAAIVICYVFNMKFKTYMLIILFIAFAYAFMVYISAYILAGKIRFFLSKSIIKKILEFSIPLGLASAIGTLNIELDKFMVGKFVDTATLAIYTNASKEMPVSIVATSFSAILLPKFARMLKKNENNEVLSLWGSSAKLGFMFVCFIGLGMYVFAPDVVTFLYSDKYISGTHIFQIYCITLLFRFTYFGMILNSNGNSNLIMYSSIVSLIINCILNYSLYMIMGLIGPAIATLISVLIMNMFQVVWTAKYMRVRLRKVLPWKQLLKILCLNIVFCVFFSLIKCIVPLDEIVGSVYESICLAVIWGIIYGFLLRNSIKREWKYLNNN